MIILVTALLFGFLTMIFEFISIIFNKKENKIAEEIAILFSILMFICMMFSFTDLIIYLLSSLSA
jgi:uncharacterized membrane protein